MEKKIYLGNDTAGYYLKQKCIEYLEGKGIPYVDCGSEDDPDIEATRYPFFAAKVAKAVAKVARQDAAFLSAEQVLV